MSGSNDQIDFKDHLKRIGSYLIALSNGDSRPEFSPFDELKDQSQSHQETADDLPRLRAAALEEYRCRKSRYKYVKSQLFSEPGWDILLDLFVARIDGKRISVTSACAASDCPPTTSLRWISVLESDGLVVRASDSSDGRRYWVMISDSGFRSMTEYLRDKINPVFLRRYTTEFKNF